jgi:hypothetical protein
VTVGPQAGTLRPRLLLGEFIPTRRLGRLLLRVLPVPPGEANRELRQAGVQRLGAGRPAVRATITLPMMRWYRSCLFHCTSTSFPKTRVDMDCFERWPKGWAFSGASMPRSRILCCSRLASSTVIVSPSATPTTVPVSVSANAPMLNISSIAGNTRFLM